MKLMEETITQTENVKVNKERESGIEIFRILTMLVIIAHHYVVNSGVIQEVCNSTILSFNSIFMLLFGWGGKTAINCFVLITGYFMCTSKITLKKFLKLLLWIEFYNIVLWIIFTATGYQEFTLLGLIKAILPIKSVSDGFSSAYLVFYLFIPFLNILIKGMNKKQHLLLMLLCFVVYTVLASLVIIPVVFNYVTWFSIIYIIGSYLRLYPEKWFSSKKIWGLSTIGMILLSWLSVLVISFVTLRWKGEIKMQYFFVADSNKPLALLTAICAFMFFKNVNIGRKKWINAIAASTFGVLLIHANSDAMRQWLWKDLLNNVGAYNTNYFWLHAILSVLGIFVICTIIDMIRLWLLEKPLFKWYDKRMKRKVQK